MNIQNIKILQQSGFVKQTKVRTSVSDDDSAAAPTNVLLMVHCCCCYCASMTHH